MEATRDRRYDAREDTPPLVARAARADARAQRRLQAAIDDLFMCDEYRLDERTRTRLAAQLRGLVQTVEGQIAADAARLLKARGATALSDTLVETTGSVLGRLLDSGLLRDPELIAELVARVRVTLIAAALPIATGQPDQPSLLARLTQAPDRIVAHAALTLLIAEARRVDTGDERVEELELPPALHARLVWRAAAALRDRAASGPATDRELLDRALSDAAERSLAALDEGERADMVAMRLAAAIDAQADEIEIMLAESLADRRLPLFIALLAHSLGVSFALARETVLDPDGDRLTLALRSLGLRRAAIARIGLSLCEADRRRGLERLVAQLDSLDELDDEVARTAIAPLRLHPDYRAALLALDRRGGR